MTFKDITSFKKNIVALGAAALLSSFSSAAQAEEPKLELSANVAMTSDYVFRGISQTQEQFAVQGGFDASYDIFYAGVWASNVDFADPSADRRDSTDVELDVYLGLKPKWRGYDFDFGAIFYLYPDANDPAGEYNFTELKAGVSYELIEDRLNMSSAVYYSPDFFGETGHVWTLESSAELSLPYELTLGATLGSVYYEDDANGEDYMYWNIGLSRKFYKDKFKLDVRYWDTDLRNFAGCQSSGRDLCDSRAVVTLSASF